MGRGGNSNSGYSQYQRKPLVHHSLSLTLSPFQGAREYLLQHFHHKLRAA